MLASRTIAWRGATVIVVGRDDLGEPGFDLLVAAEHADTLARAVRDAGAVDVDSSVAEVRRIEHGRPRFGKDMTEETIPLEAGIEDRAISLTKGCYVGQEIIIRVLHRGHGRVARRLVGLTLEPGAAVPAHGAAIRSGDREIGTVTSAALSPALGRPIAMGYVHRDFVEAGTARWRGGVPISRWPAVVDEDAVCHQPRPMKSAWLAQPVVRVVRGSSLTL